MVISTESSRPLIALNSEGRITHNGSVANVRMRSNLLRVACSDITLDAARALLQKHRQLFPEAYEENVMNEIEVQK